MNLKTSIIDYINDVKSGLFTVEEFTSATIQRINDVDGDIHAYHSLNKSAIDDAKIIDKKISSGEHVGACYGFPISIKDNICITGTKTTCASKILENFVGFRKYFFSLRSNRKFQFFSRNIRAVCTPISELQPSIKTVLLSTITSDT